MFADKRRVNRREFLRLGGAGLTGAGLLLGGVGCGGGEGTGENAIGWQATLLTRRKRRIRSVWTT